MEEAGSAPSPAGADVPAIWVVVFVLVRVLVAAFLLLSWPTASDVGAAPPTDRNATLCR